MSWDWEKLKKQQDRGLRYNTNLKGTDETGYATKLGEIIIKCVAYSIVITIVLFGVSVLSFVVGCGLELAKVFMRGLFI